jgi:hypothetical protein
LLLISIPWKFKKQLFITDSKTLQIYQPIVWLPDWENLGAITKWNTIFCHFRFYELLLLLVINTIVKHPILPDTKGDKITLKNYKRSRFLQADCTWLAIWVLYVILLLNIYCISSNVIKCILTTKKSHRKVSRTGKIVRNFLECLGTSYSNNQFSF